MTIIIRLLSIIMNTFEFNPSNGSTPSESSPSLATHQDKQYYIHKMFKIVKKYYSRAFLNHLKSCVMKALLQLSKQPKKAPQLSQEELLEMEFIGLCAQKIQAVFKGYITRKYHLKAMQKLNKFKTKLGAVALGWKTRSILRCRKMRQQMAVIKVKKAEVDREKATVTNAPNSYNIKKLEYLKRSLRQEVQVFSNRFKLFESSGSWIFQPKIAAPKPIVKRKPKQVQHVEPVQIQAYESQVQVSKPKRTREMRDRNRRGPNRQPKNKEETTKAQDNSESALENKQPNMTSQASRQTFASGLDTLEERPIKAKGAYQLDENQLIQTTSMPSLNKGKVQASEPEETGEMDKKKAARKFEKAKMEKRQKYDPRKAIQEEKKKKKQRLIQQAENTQKMVQQPSQELKKNKKSSMQAKEVQAKAVTDDVEDKSTIENRSTVVMNNRSTVGYSKAGKKAEPRIDCWTNRKTTKTKPSEEQRNTYKSIHAPNDQSLKNLGKIKNQLARIKTQDEPQQQYEGIRTKIHKEEPTESQYYRIDRQAMAQQLQRVRKESWNLQNQRKGKEEEKRKGHGVFQLKKLQISPQRQVKQRELHKTIEELEDMHSSFRYQNRLQNILPKLSLLEAARHSESKGQIPVLTGTYQDIQRKISMSTWLWTTSKNIEKYCGELSINRQ